MAQAQFDYTAFTNRSARRGFQREEMLPAQTTAPEAEGQKSAPFASVRQKYCQNNSVFSEIQFPSDGNLLEKQWIS